MSFKNFFRRGLYDEARSIAQSAALADQSEDDDQSARESNPALLLKTVDLAVAEPALDVNQEHELRKYAALAGAAGLKGVATRVHEEIASRSKEFEARKKSHELRQFLAVNGITVYDEESVTLYMNRMCKPSQSWGWVLAALCAEPDLAVNHNGQSVSLYSKPIPEAVILTIGKIREAFPSAIFEVSDVFESENADPFLRVFLREATNDSVSIRHTRTSASASMHPSEAFIIERWDEPSYRMGETK